MLRLSSPCAVPRPAGTLRREVRFPRLALPVGVARWLETLDRLHANLIAEPHHLAVAGFQKGGRCDVPPRRVQSIHRLSFWPSAVHGVLRPHVRHILTPSPGEPSGALRTAQPTASPVTANGRPSPGEGRGRPQTKGTYLMATVMPDVSLCVYDGYEDPAPRPDEFFEVDDGYADDETRKQTVVVRMRQPHDVGIQLFCPSLEWFEAALVELANQGNALRRKRREAAHHPLPETAS